MSYQRYISTVLSAAVLSAAVFFAAACGLQPVSTIKVKASPELYLPLGTKSFSADDYISPTSFADMLKSGNSSDRKGQIYYYNPPNLKEEDAGQLRYLIHYPLQSFTFDVSNYFGKEGTGTALSRSFDTSIDIPTIEEKVPTTVNTYDINTKLLAAFNKGDPQSKNITSGATGQVELPLNVRFEGFRTVTFENYSAALTVSTQSATVSYSITSATLSTNGSDIPGTITNNWDNTKDIRFPLDGRTIGADMRLSITINVLHSTGGAIEITRKLDGTIARADGVSADLDDIELSEGSINIALPEGFRSAKIGTGSVNLDVPQPAGWQNITMQYKTSISQSGVSGLNLAPVAFTAVGTPIDLAGQQLNSNRQFTYKPVLKVRLNDATYTRSDTPIQAECSVSIGKFETVTLANRQDFAKAQNEPVPSDMKKWVQSIHIKKVTAKVVLTNNLPEGNPININLESDVFGIKGTDHNGTSGVFPAQAQNNEQNYPGKENFDLDITTTQTFDLSTRVVPGFSSEQNAYTLKNIETGKKVAFSGKVDFDIDWESMVVKADKEQKTSFPEKGVLNVPMLSQLKKAGIKLDKIPMYFYAGSNSNLFGDTEIKLGLSVESLTENGISTPKPLLSESHKLVPLPADAFKDAEGEEGKTKTLTKAVPEPMFTVHDLHETLNTYPDGIRFNYTISMDKGVTITREAYNKAKEGGSATINVDLLLDFPIGFTVAKPKGDDETEGALELSSLMGKQNPIELVGQDGSFNGGIPLTKEQLRVKKLQLNTYLENKSGFSPAFILRINDKDNKNKLLDDKKISLAAGNQELKFTSEEWDKLKEAGAFIPVLYLKLEPGSHKLKKDLDFKITLSVTVAADIEYEVLGGGSN